jgi:hypothetical protein
MSEEEVQAALRSMEDEGDRAAAAALERETAAELAEFSADPGPGRPGADADADADDDDADADDTRYSLPVLFGSRAPHGGCSRACIIIWKTVSS